MPALPCLPTQALQNVVHILAKDLQGLHCALCNSTIQSLALNEHTAGSSAITAPVLSKQAMSINIELEVPLSKTCNPWVR